MPFFRNLQPRVLLDLAGLQCHVGRVQAGESAGLNVDQLGGVEPSRYSIQRACQCSPGRGFLRHPKAFSCAGAVHPQEMPAHLTNYVVENRRRDLFQKIPVFAAGLTEGVQSAGKDAFFAQENGMRRQACALFNTAGASGRKEPGK